MDPLSITASVIAVLQAANVLISVCYDFRSALRNAPWGLSKVISETQDLRHILEILVKLAEELEVDDAVDSSEKEKRLPALKQLCNPTNGPLVSILEEVTNLEKTLTPSRWYGKSGPGKRALIQSIGWQLKDRQVKDSIARIERHKSTLALALSSDQALLLLRLQNTTISIDNAVQNIGQEFATLSADMRLDKSMFLNSDEKYRRMITWLSTVDPRENHEAAVTAHQQGTGDWFTASAEFSDWHAAPNSFLWLSGFPGAGKTVLFSTAVRYFEDNLTTVHPGALMAYFYCDFRRQEMQEPLNVAASLVSQLCVKSGSFPEGLERAFDQSAEVPGQQKRPSISDLQLALSWFARRQKILLFLDALDECNDQEILIDFITGLRELKGDCNILITSRDEECFTEAFSALPRLRLESQLKEMAEDIGSYIINRLQSDRKLQWLDESISESIASLLYSKSAGMFRWVDCQLDAMAKLRTVKAIRKALNQLPQGLDETYENILSKVSAEETEIVRRILQWLAFAVLPMTLEEVHEAVAIEKGLDHLDEESRLSSPRDILTLCGSLVSVSDDSHITLAHMSVKDYLLSSDLLHSRVSLFTISAKDSYPQLALDCMTYLSFAEMKRGPSTTLDDYRDRLIRHPFLEHASKGWPYYVKYASEDSSLASHVADFLSPQARGQFMSWVQIINAGDNEYKWDFYPRHATSLYYAASFGLEDAVHSIIESGEDLNAPGSRFGGTALHAAVIRQHTAVMKSLLEAGANPDQADFDQTSPLHTACAYGNKEVVSLLLEFGASPNTVDMVGETPFQWALVAGQFESANLLRGSSTGKKEETTILEDEDARRSGLDSSVIVGIERVDSH